MDLSETMASEKNLKRLLPNLTVEFKQNIRQKFALLFISIGANKLEADKQHLYPRHRLKIELAIAILVR